MRKLREGVCRACGEPNDRYVGTDAKLCSACKMKRELRSAAKSPSFIDLGAGASMRVPSSASPETCEALADLGQAVVGALREPDMERAVARLCEGLDPSVEVSQVRLAPGVLEEIGQAAVVLAEDNASEPDE